MVYQITCSLYPMLAAPLVCQVIGMLWYGPLFGKSWAVDMGFGSMENMAPSVMPFLLTIMSNFLTTFLMINFHHIVMVASLQQAFLLAWIFWVATIALRMPHYAFGMKSLRLFLIDSVFDLVIAIAVSDVVFLLHSA